MAVSAIHAMYRSCRVYTGLIPQYSKLRVSLCQKQLPLMVCQPLHFFRSLSTNELSHPPVPADSSTDILLSNLKYAREPHEVLELIGAHLPIMNQGHCIQALESLFTLQKSGRSNLTTTDIVRNERFQSLCKNLKKHARSLSLRDTIECLKIITYMGVPSKSAITQILLQLIRHSINDLEINEIVFLDFILKKLERCSLVDALNIALPIVFETQLKIKLDRENLRYVSEMLDYSVKQKLSPSTIDFLVNCLLESLDRIDTKTARNIAISIGNLNRVASKSAPFLLRQALNVVLSHIDEWSVDDLTLILSKLVSSYPQFYHEDFIGECVKFIMRRDCSFEQCVSFHGRLMSFGYADISFLEFMSKKVEENPSELDTKFYFLYNFVRGLSFANYKPHNWEIIQRHILNSKLFLLDEVKMPWIRLALDLASLGLFNEKLLSKVFEEKFLRNFLSRDHNLLDYLQLLQLYQATTALFPEYAGTMPPQDIIDKAIEVQYKKKDDFPLRSALEKGFGGPSYVLTNIHNKYGYYLDHIIVLRSGNYPVALNQDKNEDDKVLLEDLDIPPDCQLVVVQGLASSCYTSNNHRLRGKSDLRCRVLESRGFVVVPISISSWSSFPDHEKIPYLMQKIKEKYECDVKSVTFVG